MTEGMKKAMLKIAGHVCLLLGLAGAFLPLLPTTPFLLLAAACYVRSSEKHHRWLVNHPVFGPPIRDYQEKRALRPRTKAIALTLLWCSLLLSAWRVGKDYLYVVLFVVGILLSFMILRIRTLREEKAR